MASAASSRLGLITATVVMSIVAITSLIFAAIFAASSSKATKDLADLQRKYAEITKDPNGPTVSELRALRDMEGSGFSKNDSLLDVAVGSRNNLVKLVGGADYGSAQTGFKSAATGGAEAMKAAGQPETSTTDNAAATITSMANTIKAQAAQIAQLTKDATDAKSAQAQTVKDYDTASAAKNKQVQDSQAEAAKARADADKVTQDMKGVADASQQTIEGLTKTQSGKLATLEQQKADAEIRAKALDTSNKNIQNKLDMFRPNSNQSLIRQADGSISKINTDGTVYINVGAGQQIQPGMTFEIYEKTSGVPALRNDETSLPIGKGSIEVLRVGNTYSECRVLKTTPGRTVTEGDIVANLIYDRNVKLKFVIFGKFDLTKPGTPDAADATILKRLVTEWGATLQPDVGIDTDFLVIGAEPKVPDFTDEQRRDPVNAKTLADAQAEVDKYRDILNRAKDMSIPVLNQNRFLYYIGYYDSAHR